MININEKNFLLLLANKSRLKLGKNKVHHWWDYTSSCGSEAICFICNKYFTNYMIVYEHGEQHLKDNKLICFI